MINALFSSKANGTKHLLMVTHVYLGGKQLWILYQRELARVSQNCTRMVLRLKEAHCLHDAWTKLNVHPAKIMQVSYKIYFIYYLSDIYSKNKCWGTSLVHPPGSTTQRCVNNEGDLVVFGVLNN